MGFVTSLIVDCLLLVVWLFGVVCYLICGIVYHFQSLRGLCLRLVVPWVVWAVG